MKATTLILLCAASIATCALTSSCNSDSDYGTSSLTTLTLSDSIEANTDVVGSYDGCIFVNDDDSITGVTWTVKAVSKKESTMTMDNFPASAIATLLDDDLAPVATILAAADDQALTFDVIPVLKVAYSSYTIYEYSVLPTDVLQFEVVVGNTSHIATVNFGDYYEDTNGYYYYPMAIIEDDVFQGNIILESIVVDDVTYELDTVFGFKATKGSGETSDRITTTE